jgi:hypothetical protein
MKPTKRRWVRQGEGMNEIKEIHTHIYTYVYKERVLKSFIFCNITLCSPMKVNRRFGGIYRLHLQGLFITAFTLIPSSDILRPSRYVPPKRRLIFNGLHGDISQMVIFITTAVRTSKSYMNSRMIGE